MSNTIFIALQCCQCSIMQVRQRKKSSNKWTCVVCNQKQSVRNVFAQGYKAKDLRQFVQSFNMSLQDPPLSDQQEEEEDEETAMPNKRPKLNKYPHSGGLATGEGEGEGYDQFYKSILSSQAKVREANEPQQSTGQVASKWSDYLTQEDKEELRTCQPTMSNDKTQDDMKNPRNSHATMGKAASKWSEYLTEDEPEQRIPRPPKGNGASKWKTLLTQEENDLQDSTGREFVDDHKGEWRNGIFDQEVEDDIHPDFI
ncbi:hypothetical protein ACOSP7_009462 [Xanthoceras sorbifolium]